MKRKAIFTILFVLIFGFIQQTSGQNLSAEQTEIIKEQIDSKFSEMLAYAERLDYNKLSSGVEDSRGAGFIANNQYYTDYSSLFNAVKKGIKGVRSQYIAIDNKKITVLSESLALLTSSGRVEILLEDDRKIFVSFCWSFVYEKINDNWKVIHSHQSNKR